MNNFQLNNGSQNLQNGEQKIKKKKYEKYEDQEEQEEQDQQQKKLKKKLKKQIKKEKIQQEQNYNLDLNKEQNLKNNIHQLQDIIVKKKKIEVDNFDQQQVEQWRKDNQLIVQGENSQEIKPFRSFQESGIDENILKITKKFDKLTPIQAQAWPILLNNRDCIAIAETGSGKTLGFLIPAFVRILNNKKNKNYKPQVFILSPTRELATQIAEVCEEAGKYCGVKSTCIYGGVPKREQRIALEQGVHVVIGTPGRMADLIQEGVLLTDNVDLIILDEADRMLEEGFKYQITQIYDQISPKRQNMMFSATWPNEVQQLAKTYISNPITIKIGTDEGQSNKRITQIVEVIDDRQKGQKLQELLKKYHKNQNNKIIIFVLYKLEAARVEDSLLRQGWKCVSIHGDKNQLQRNQAYDQFKNNLVPLLIATDVAARGLDIPNVEYVINYTFPLTIQDYIHRIGRTGRAGKTGVSHTFFTQNEKNLAGDLCEELKQAGQIIPDQLKKFGPSVHKQKEHPMYGKFYNESLINIKPTIKKLC